MANMEFQAGDLKIKDIIKKPTVKDGRVNVTLAQLLIEREHLESLDPETVLTVAPINMRSVVQLERKYGSIDSIPSNPDTMTAEDIVFMASVLVNQELPANKQLNEDAVASLLRGDRLHEVSEVIYRMVLPLFDASRPKTQTA